MFRIAGNTDIQGFDETEKHEVNELLTECKLLIDQIENPELYESRERRKANEAISSKNLHFLI